jgi:hypothetical protein
MQSTLQDAGIVNDGVINKDDKGMLGIRYNDLLAPMVKAIQQQQQLIEAQQKEIEAMRKRLELVEKK